MLKLASAHALHGKSHVPDGVHFTVGNAEIVVPLEEQKRTVALDVADRCLEMGHGQIVFEGTPVDLRAAGLSQDARTCRRSRAPPMRLTCP